MIERTLVPTNTGTPQELVNTHIEFWRLIYGKQQGYLGLAAGRRDPETKRFNGEGEWEQAFFRWPEEASQAVRWVDQHRDTYEIFHTVSLLKEPERKKEYAAPVQALWVDVDNPAADWPDTLPPTIRVETSPGKWQGYFVLTKAIPPEQAEALNRRLQSLGADSTPDPGRLFRTPGACNYKYPDAPRVQIREKDRQRVYDPDELDQHLPPLPEPLPAGSPRPENPAPRLATIPTDLPPVDVGSLQVAPDTEWLIRDGVPRGKRSEALFRVIRDLHEAGYDDPTISSVLLDPCNGISEKPREQGRDWLAGEIARVKAKGGAVGPAGTACAALPGPKGFRTLAERRSGPGAVPLEPEWILEGFIAKKAITLLAGPSKDEGGKTTFLAGLLKAVETGAPYCGLRTQKTRVVYLSEETPLTLDLRAQKLGLNPEWVSYLTADDVETYPDWDARIDAAIAAAERLQADLLVVDTISFWAGFAAEREWDDATVTEHFKTLRRATGKGLAVVVVHHFNKQGIYRGATAFKASVDIYCEFARAKHGPPTRRNLKAVGRLGSCELTLDFDSATERYGCKVGSLGPAISKIRDVGCDPPKESAPRRGVRKVRDFEYGVRTTAGAHLPQTNLIEQVRDRIPMDGWITRKMLHQQLPQISQATLRRALDRLVQNDSTITRQGTGRKGDPYQYCRTSFLARTVA